MAESLFSLRAAVEADREYVDAYCYGEGMDRLPSLENVIVAENDIGEPVGFVRIARAAQAACADDVRLPGHDVAYVNPVVVHETWRGFGVGRALVEAAQETCDELRLVSRGSSKPFYDALGFECCGWELIAEGVSEDCAHCTMTQECGPQPMRRMTRMTARLDE